MKLPLVPFLVLPLSASLHAQMSDFAAQFDAMQKVETAICPRVADFNGDGVPDFAILRDGTIDHVEIGLGAVPPLVASLDYPMMLGSPAARKGGGSGLNEGIMAVGQCAGSGLPDVVVPTISGFIYLFENLGGNPTVSTGWRSTLLSGLGLMTDIHDLSLTDINGDGQLDLVVLWASTVSTVPNQIRIFYNNGPLNPAGPFSASNSSAAILWTGTGQGRPSSMAFHDGNRDGLVDSILCGIDDLSNTRAIGFQIQRSATSAPSFNLLPWSVLLNSDNPYHATVADFDGDGVDDVAFACFLNSSVRSSVHVLRLGLTPSLQPVGTLQSFFQGYVRSMVALDMDLNGFSDLVLTTTSGNGNFGTNVAAFLSAGQAGFSPVPLWIPTNGGSALLPMQDVTAVVDCEISIPSDNRRDLVICGDFTSPSNRRGIRVLENRAAYPWLSFGSGCTGSGSATPLTLSFVTNAVRGQTYSFRLSGIPSGAGLCAATFGFSNASASGFGSLPAELGALGAPGCFLYVSPNFMTYQLHNGSGLSNFSIAVPSVPTLLGLSFFNQGVAFNPTSNFLGMITSNACAVRVL